MKESLFYRAMNAPDGTWSKRWLMACASYEYSREHGLSLWDALAGAWDILRSNE